MTGLYHAREARGMSRTELVRRSGVSKQQLSRLENGHIRLRLDHLKPFASVLGYSPEQILLWGRLPELLAANSGGAPRQGEGQGERGASDSVRVPELEIAGGAVTASSRESRRHGRHADKIKTERWVFPPTFVREELHAAATQLIVLNVNGDSMTPTLISGDRVIIDAGHKTPTPDGLYAIRDALAGIVVKRLQLLRSVRPSRVKIISDNPNHAAEEVPIDELEIVGKAIGCIKLI
jgi:transcriptional regulator with XRE-family HTH domain